MTKFEEQFITARRVSTPLVAVRTSDPASTIRLVTRALGEYVKKGATACPIAHWDIMRGLQGLNAEGIRAASEIHAGAKPEMATAKPTDALGRVFKATDTKLTPNSAIPAAREIVLFMANAQMFWKNEAVTQAIWNLRDTFKAEGAMLVMLVSLGSILPIELAQDVMVIDDPLPDAGQLQQIIRQTYNDVKAGMKPDAETLSRATDALMGLSAFPAEQATSMHLKSTTGLDLDGLWERKRKTIEQVRGLSVWRGGEKFSDLGGLENAKGYFNRLLSGPKRPDGIVFTDEIEKVFAGFGTDSSGTTTKSVGAILAYMEDHQITGSLFLGPPGSGKSALGKALGNEAGVPTIQADFAAMETSLVGATGENIRAAMAVIDAMFKNPLFIGTCNSWGSLPPELRRRYRLATFFYDFPTKEEREIIWGIYLKKYNMAGEIPNDSGWTGAEIRNCCDTAFRLNCSLAEAACYVVPVSVSAAEQMNQLRMDASGKFVSASKPGMYLYAGAEAGKNRKIREMDIDTFDRKGGTA